MIAQSENICSDQLCISIEHKSLDEISSKHKTNDVRPTVRWFDRLRYCSVLTTVSQKRNGTIDGDESKVSSCAAELIIFADVYILPKIQLRLVCRDT